MLSATTTTPRGSRGASQLQRGLPGRQPRPGSLPTARDMPRRLGELLLGVAVALLVSLTVQWTVSRLPMPRPSSLPDVVIMVGCGAALVIIVTAVAVRRTPRWLPGAAAWAVLPGALTLVLSAVLHGSRYYLGGIEIDQMFRVEYFTRMTSTASLVDFSYQGLPPYYPAGWFWLGGRFANIAGMPGWAAYKPFAILTVAVVAGATYWLWSFSVRRRLALLLTALQSVIGMGVGASGTAVAVSEPYSWLAVATIPPLAVLAWRLLTVLRGQGSTRGSYATAVLLGLVVGAYGATYTLYAIFAALVLVVVAAGGVVAHRRHPHPGTTLGTVLRRVAGHTAALVVPAAAVMATVWTPYALAVLSGGSSHNIAAHYLPAASASFPLPFLKVSVSGVLCLAGLGWLVFATLGRSRYPSVAYGLAAGVVSCYLWYLLSELALLANTTLLAFRITPILIGFLLAAAGMALVEALQLAAPLAAAHWQRPLRGLAAIIATAVLLSILQGFPSDHHRLVKAAFHDYYPTGHPAVGKADPGNPDYWTPQLNATIARLSGRPPASNVVYATKPELLLDTTPYWRFQATTAHYANPLGHFNRRRALVLHWAQAPDPASLAAELDRSPYRAPNVFVFLHKPGGKLITTVNRDIFPREPNVGHKTVTFHASQFAGPQFQRKDVGPFTVIVRNEP